MWREVWWLVNHVLSAVKRAEDQLELREEDEAKVADLSREKQHLLASHVQVLAEPASEPSQAGTALPADHGNPGQPPTTPGGFEELDRILAQNREVLEHAWSTMMVESQFDPGDLVRHFKYTHKVVRRLDDGRVGEILWPVTCSKVWSALTGSLGCGHCFRAQALLTPEHERETEFSEA